jgi:F plasmid transfer operon, TraF, protein
MRNASRPLVCFLFVSLVSFVSLALPAAAQQADVVGVRAQGMAGAFTAVADDANAAWWNPAGMAGGAYFNALIEWGSHREPSSDAAPTGGLQPARGDEVRSFAVGFPALGLSYYHLRLSEIQPQTSTAGAAGDRQEGGTIQVRLASTTITQFGATVGQSLGQHFVIATTAKLIHAGAITQFRPAADGSLDAAAELDPEGETKGGLDAGAMATFGPVRVGVMVRNLTEPEFGTGVGSFTLSRTARVGAAVSTGRRGVIGTATVAVDADLTTASTVFGDERRFAAGGEVWTTNRMLGVRGGVGVNTIGDQRTSLSGGVSAALKKGFYADGELTGGTDLGRHGWSLGLRVTF